DPTALTSPLASFGRLAGYLTNGEVQGLLVGSERDLSKKVQEEYAAKPEPGESLETVLQNNPEMRDLYQLVTQRHKKWEKKPSFPLLLNAQVVARLRGVPDLLTGLLESKSFQQYWHKSL